jgi:hypothetical protein
MTYNPLHQFFIEGMIGALVAKECNRDFFIVGKITSSTSLSCKFLCGVDSGSPHY